MDGAIVGGVVQRVEVEWRHVCGEIREMRSLRSISGWLACMAMCFSVGLWADRPNVVYILCDDLGYGDVGCLNREGKIRTPQMDRIAREGAIFKDAHSGSSVCTPTRYGIMTGRYCWRSRLQSGVLGGLSPSLIEEGRMTVASYLRSKGYRTAVIGKWHLGMDWKVNAPEGITPLGIEKAGQVRNVEYGAEIAGGPISAGFERYFGVSASLDMVPYTFIEGRKVMALPEEDGSFPMYLGRDRGRTRVGPLAKGFDAGDVLPRLIDEAVSYVKERGAEAREGRPFFLYVPLTSPHTPILPSEAWRGRSGLGAYGDFVMQTDDGIGRILAEVEAQGIGKSTLFVVTSDNGCSPAADIKGLQDQGHQPSERYRGHKADIFDGGHRVPFLVRWPDRVRAGLEVDGLVCLTDLLATVSEIVGDRLPEGAGEDSVSFLPLLEGRVGGREEVVHHSINGSFAIRDRRWKLAFCGDSGGWSEPRPGKSAKELPAVQLFDMQSDVSETRNVELDHASEVSRLTERMERIIREGRSTLGPARANDVEVRLRKRG